MADRVIMEGKDEATKIRDSREELISKLRGLSLGEHWEVGRAEVKIDVHLDGSPGIKHFSVVSEQEGGLEKLARDQKIDITFEELIRTDKPFEKTHEDLIQAIIQATVVLILRGQSINF